MDGHPKVINYPFNIGYNLIYNDFIKFCNRDKLKYDELIDNHDELKKFLIHVNNKDEIYELQIGDILTFIFSHSDRLLNYVSCTGKIHSPELNGKVSIKDYDIDFSGFLNEFIQKYNDLPTKEALLIDIDKIKNISEIDYDSSLKLIEKLDEPDSVEEQWLLDATEEFCQERAIYNAIMDSIGIIDGKDKNKGYLQELERLEGDYKMRLAEFRKLFPYYARENNLKDLAKEFDWVHKL